MLGKQLKLFTISQVVGSGLILWMPQGATVRGLLETFIKDELLKRGYQPVYTPHIGRLELYRTSGHFPYYRDAQYPPMYFHPAGSALDLAQYRLAAGELDETKEREMAQLPGADPVSTCPATRRPRPARTSWRPSIATSCNVLEAMDVELPDYDKATVAAERAEVLLSWLEEQEGYLLKPMNCPHHIQIYKAEPRSYRDLPVRLAEFGTVYRFEQTGELSGMTRVRGFTQDDAHLFVTPEQIEAEIRRQHRSGAVRAVEPGPERLPRARRPARSRRATSTSASAEDWDKAEQTLLELVKSRGMNYTAEQGEAAFYGPKIDFVVRDCIGREWQLGTVQLDYNLPKRFELEYIGADNQPHRPVMIHRAPFGSMERFMGILIEHFAGAFPLWLAPEQARVLPVSEKFSDYGQQGRGGAARRRASASTGDYRPEKIGYKIREAQLEKIPYMLVVGEKEQAAGTVAVRDRVDGDLGAMPVAAADRSGSSEEVEEKRIRQVSTATAGLADGGAKFGE